LSIAGKDNASFLRNVLIIALPALRLTDPPCHLLIERVHIIAMMNWSVAGSIGPRLPQVAALFQACISVRKRATIQRDEFLDTTGLW